MTRDSPSDSTQFSRLKEDLLRTNAEAFGARYLLDFVVPGGVACGLAAESQDVLVQQLPVAGDRRPRIAEAV